MAHANLITSVLQTPSLPIPEKNLTGAHVCACMRKPTAGMHGKCLCNYAEKVGGTSTVV